MKFIHKKINFGSVKNKDLEKKIKKERPKIKGKFQFNKK